MTAGSSPIFPRSLLSVAARNFGNRAASYISGRYTARFYTIAVSVMIGSASVLDAASATSDSDR